MKKHFTIITLLFLFNFGFSQFGTRYEEVQIMLKDGTTINGYGNMLDNELKVKDSNKKNKRKISFADISIAKFYLYSGKKKPVKKELTLVGIELEPKYNNRKEYVLAEEILSKEKIKIYGVYPLAGGAKMGPGLGGQISVTNINLGYDSNNYVDFYCLIKNEKFPRVIYNKSNFVKTFRIMGAECFKDCKELSDKINNKEFTTNHLQEIGNFYNSKCK